MTLKLGHPFSLTIGEHPRVILFPEDKMYFLVEQIASYLFHKQEKSLTRAQMIPLLCHKSI